VLRALGAEDALRSHGLTLDEAHYVETRLTLDDGYKTAFRFFQQNPPVDAAFCMSDAAAVGVIRALADLGKRVPEDVQITGIGDSQLSQIARPSLTTAHLYYQRSGIEAARLLVERMENPGKTNAVEVKMGYEVYGRMSMR
jgi:LacI family sucrose operon transcriptional repressor